MARARNIKPGFFKNEDLAECSPWARLCFVGLWTLADCEGRLEDRAKRIKGELFAFDSIEVEPLLADLEKHGFIERYAVNGRGLIQITAFLKHQNPHHREPESDLPPAQSLGLEVDATAPKPQALPPSNTPEAPGKAEALKPRSDLARGSSRAESGIDESGIDESGTLIPEKKPKASKPGAIAPAVLVAAGFDEQTAHDFLACKADRKAPLTDRAWKDHLAEAAKAGWTPLAAAEKVMAKTWKGFEAKYVAREGQPNGALSFRERDAAAAAAEVNRWTGGRLGARPAQDVIDMEAPNARLNRS